MGDTYCNDLRDYLFKIIQNITFKSVLLILIIELKINKKKGFKRKNLNYKKVGDTYCNDLRDYLFKIIQNIMFKSVLEIYDI